MNKNQHWPTLLNLIRQNGFWANCMSTSGDSCILQRCAIIVGGYVIGEDGSVYPPEDVHRSFEAEE